MPAVDVLRRKREMGYDDSRDQAGPSARAIPISDEEKQQFASMGYQPGQPVNLAVQGTWDGESVSVDTVQCMPQAGAPQQQGQMPPTPQGDPIVRMNPAPVPG